MRKIRKEFNMSIHLTFFDNEANYNDDRYLAQCNYSHSEYDKVFSILEVLRAKKITPDFVKENNKNWWFSIVPYIDFDGTYFVLSLNDIIHGYKNIPDERTHLFLKDALNNFFKTDPKRSSQEPEFLLVFSD